MDQSIARENIQKIFSKQAEDMTGVLLKDILKLEPGRAHNACRRSIEGCDTIINLFTEIKDKELLISVMILKLDDIIACNENYQAIKSDLENTLGNIAVERLESFICDYAAANMLLKNRAHPFLFPAQNLKTVIDLFKYTHQRRRYFVTYLSLISEFANGGKVVNNYEYLELALYWTEAFSVPITTARNILLMDQCYEDFELESSGGFVTWNKRFEHLEGLSLEPQRLNLMQQIEFREVDGLDELRPTKPANVMFAFEELEDTLEIYKCAYADYGVEKIRAFQELQKLAPDLKKYLLHDYIIEIPENDFKVIQLEYPHLDLILSSRNYYDHLNSTSPFSFSNGLYYTNVMLLVRYITNMLTTKLERNKRFQIRSGFIFEKSVISLFESYGFHYTGYTRINRKEFDLIFTRDGEIHNFQCKNNIFEISLIDQDIKRNMKINDKLCKYYKAAYDKEKRREDLVKDKVGLTKITHYVLSRFPIMTNQSYVVSFNELEPWLIKNFSDSKFL